MSAFSRRDFLQQTALGLLLGSLPLSARAEESSISLGFSLYGMKDLSLEAAFKTCAEFGYRNIELSLLPGYPSEPKQLSDADRKKLQTQLREHHLTVSALMLNLNLLADPATHIQHLEAIKAAAQLAHDLAPEHPPIIETVLGGKPDQWESVREGMLTQLQAWAATATEAKIQLAIKAHVGSAVNSPERLLWLLEKVPNPAIVVAYDYSHFELGGIDLEKSLKALLPRTVFIHVKDSMGTPGKFQFLLPGEGRTDYPAYFRLLKEFHYRGPIVVEVSAQVFKQPGYDPVAAARGSAARLSAALKSAGL